MLHILIKVQMNKIRSNVKIDMDFQFLAGNISFEFKENSPFLTCRDSVRFFLWRWQSERNAVSESLHEFTRFTSGNFWRIFEEVRKPFSVNVCNDNEKTFEKMMILKRILLTKQLKFQVQ